MEQHGADDAAYSRGLRGLLPAALWVTLVLLPTLLTKLGANLNPDEHQFIVAGVLLACEGLLPYRDYVYFHVPNLALVYAAVLFSVAQSLLLWVLLFSLACGALLLLTMSSMLSAAGAEGRPRRVE